MIFRDNTNAPLIRTIDLFREHCKILREAYRIRQIKAVHKLDNYNLQK